jgi:prephenate dehydrogenase
MHFQRLALIGCGLIGGSFAMGLKQNNSVSHVAGFSATQQSLNNALELGVIDSQACSIRQAIDGADLVMVAVPVNAVEGCLQEMAGHLNPNALVMDVGSTKNLISQQAMKIMGAQAPLFVPAHPIAGKELHGVEHASATLFSQHKTVLTPHPLNQSDRIDRAREVWESLGSEVLCMTPMEHDKALAGVSHLPHFIAFAAVNALNAQTDHETFWRLAGPGFRDFSRIAAGSSGVWRDIFLSNTQEIRLQLQVFQQALHDLDLALTHEDSSAELERLIDAASRARQAWSHSA